MGIHELKLHDEKERLVGYKLPASVKHKLSEGRTVLSYIIGDCSALDAFLIKQSGLLWVIPKYLNALFRGVGQVIFLNNPFSGFLVLFSLYWADITVGLATTLAASTAILTAFIFVQDESKINAGLTTYNAVLVGSVTSSLWEPQYGEPITLKLWGFIILAAALSVLVNAGLANLLGSFKPTLPSFTLAFNIVTILLFTTLMPRPTTTAKSSRSEKDLDIITLIQDENLHWVGVVQGILLSMGQVYAINNMVGSIIMYLSCLFYSPIVLVMSLVGATVGSMFGIVFAAPNYDSVYNGIWGFNAILAAIAVGAFFFIPNGVSFGVAVGDVALVVMIQQALTIALTPLKLPFFTFPFVLSSIIFLEVTATRDKLHRVSKFSFPEMHIYEYLESLRNKSSAADSNTVKPMEKYDPTEVITLVPRRTDHHYSPSAPSLQQLYPELAKTSEIGNYNGNPGRDQYNGSLRQRTHPTSEFENNRPHYTSIPIQLRSARETPFYAEPYRDSLSNQQRQNIFTPVSPSSYPEERLSSSYDPYNQQAFPRSSQVNVRQYLDQGHLTETGMHKYYPLNSGAYFKDQWHRRTD